MTNTDTYLKDFSSTSFQTHLIQWFEQNKRDMPWRKTSDPYHIWISEVMLQQTQVDTVIPYYERFIARFPTVFDLASDEEQDVLKHWEGLGYYSRARNLQKGAQQVVEQYKGIMPQTLKEILAIKGIGPYTAGAVLSIAYGVPEPAVDGNVFRVLSRVLSVWEDIAKPQTRKTFEALVREIIDPNNPSFFNQGIMELGATICKPKNPLCSQCPVQTECKAFNEHAQEELPIKSKKKPPTPVSIAVAAIRNSEGRYLLRKRPESGLLANLWEFINVETNEEQKKDELTLYVEGITGKSMELTHSLFSLSHTFTHLKWNMDLYHTTNDTEARDIPDTKWLSLEEIATYPLPVSHQKIHRFLQSIEDVYSL